MSKRELVENVEGHTYNSDQQPVLAFCVVASADDDSIPTAVADSKCQLPVSFTRRSDAEQCQVFTSSVLVNVDSAIVSCLCLGTSYATTSTTTVSKIFGRHSSPAIATAVDLPLYKSDLSLTTANGSCVLLECHGMYFIASVQLRCDLVSALGRHWTSQNGVDAVARRPATASSSLAAVKASPFTIQQCLCQDRPTLQNDGHLTFLGLLVRQRFRFVKARSSSFMGCVLTLSHAPVPETHDDRPLSASHLSAVQSIELKVSIPSSNDQLLILRMAMRKLVGDDAGGILPEQEDVAAAWWQMSDSGHASSLVANGFDDFVDTAGQRPIAASMSLLGEHGNQEDSNEEGLSTSPNRASLLSVPIVTVPCSAMTKGGHGYLRFQCSLTEIRSSYINVVVDGGPPRSIDIKPPFDAIGGRKCLPGTLDRRPRRRSHPCGVGELMAVPSDYHCGVSASTLADLHWQICADMRNQTQSALAPSMVRVIRNARLLSISFCLAQAECTRCFQPLVETKPKNGYKSGVVSSVQVSTADAKDTYWHIPLPIDTADGGASTMPASSNARAHSSNANLSRRRTTTLACHNGCPIEHASIKWECSGVVDDGSGQAKLYAEREAALSLLGASLYVAEIEAGAWHVEGGILFQKTVPPKSIVKQAVLQAQTLAYQEHINATKQHHKRQRRPLPKEEDVIKYLTREARAEYYLQQACRRQQSSPLRALDYYVRCKPLSKDASHLNQTQVEMSTPPIRDYMPASTMDVTTYSLPPLKLIVVDCSIPSQLCGNTMTDCSSWDLLRTLRDAVNENSTND